MGIEEAKATLTDSPKVWTVTGAAGFIGSHLVQALLLLEQKVIGFDNLCTGSAANLDYIKQVVGERWRNFRWVKGDIRDPADCKEAVAGADFVLHQAALGSVPRSLTAPLETNATNVSGFVNILEAGRAAKVRRFVFASSSSVYGDAQELPQIEEKIGNPLSPYAVTKRVNELYAEAFGRCYGMQWTGLRYFNVFGSRQDANGSYAAVIPKWISALMSGNPVCINGDGSTSRDFCPVANVVQANLLAATAPKPDAVNTIYNVALGSETTLLRLFEILRDKLRNRGFSSKIGEPEFRPFQAGDVRHSRADIGKAQKFLGYAPTHSVDAGLDEAIEWQAGFRAEKK